ncbi:MAG: hypothetical protein ACTSYX_02895 [Candidatus Thorarchaeota archaeon]
MALAVTSGLTEWDDCDVDDWTGDPSVGLEEDFHIEGVGCLGMDVDIETHQVFGAAVSFVNMSTQFIYMWMFSFTASTLDTKAAGGMQILVEDGSGNQSGWYVGGSDNYTGGWEVFCCSCAETPNWDSGTPADLTDIVKIGTGWKNTAKSKLPMNCFWDWIRYGTGPALTITGTNATVGDGWSEVATLDLAGTHGIVKAVKGGYILKGPVQIGDSAGTLSTDFTDEGSVLNFDDQPVGEVQYKITEAGNGTGTTDLQLGSVVGTGDDRQGINGNIIGSLGPAWEWDSQTDIADLDTCLLYGTTFKNAHGGINLDDDTKTTLISFTALNCGEVDPGAVNDGAELLSVFIIDPNGTTNNYGLLFGQTVVTAALTHNCKKINFITSGTPTTQYMARFIDASDYSVTWDQFNYFGVYTSGTIQQGRNEGLNADVTIDVATNGNVDDTDFTNSASGTVTANNVVNLNVTVKDIAGVVIQNAQTAIYVKSDNTELMNEDTTAGGLATATYNYSGNTDVFVKVRKSSTGTTRYRSVSSPQTIIADGLTVTITLEVDNNAAA